MDIGRTAGRGPRRTGGLALALCISAMPGWAQPDPSHEQQRQLQREREQLGQIESPGPRARLPAAVQSDIGLLKLPQDEMPCFVIRRMNIVHAEEGNSDVFGWLRPYADTTRLGEHDPVANRCLGALGIERLLARLQDALVARGYITTRVQTLPQDLNSGQLIVTLTPGRIRAIRPAEPEHAHIALSNAFPMRAGDVLRLGDVEQGLENLQRAPSAHVDIGIEPGEEPGQSDIVVDYRQNMPLRGAISLDDSGSKATGRHLASLALSYDNWWARSDLLYASISGSLDGGHARGQSSRSLLIHYSIPYGYWLLNLSYSDSDYRQTMAGLSQNYIYRGSASHMQATLSRVLWRSGSHRLSASARIFQRRSRNYIDDTEVQVQRRATAGWELGLNLRAWLDSAVLDANLNYRRGTGAFGALAAPEQGFGEGTSRFRTLNAELNLSLPFTVGEQRLSYGVLVRGQVNRTPLAPQERFAIGGRYSVRGFDGELSLAADRGWLLRNELGWAVGNSGQQTYLGLDWGWVGGQSARWLAGRELAGAVIGLRGSWQSWQYDAFVGRPLHQPTGFKTARHVVGFSASLQF